MKKVEIALAVLVLVVLGAIGWDRIVDPLLHRETYRGEVRTLYENLHLGMTKEQVRRETESGRYPHLDFHREGQLWLGSAPLEFGAGNWVLAIEFQDDQVFSVRVRKGDGLQDIHHPIDAPPDKLASKNFAAASSASAKRSSAAATSPFLSLLRQGWREFTDQLFHCQMGNGAGVTALPGSAAFSCPAGRGNGLNEPSWSIHPAM